METILENAYLRVGVRSCGAELCSVWQKDTGRECLWQGDPAVWPGQAPLLFPHCGRLQNDILLAKGREYPAPRHGFARKMDFTCEEAGAEYARFTLCSSPETEARFPYAFKLLVEYRLQENTLLQSVTVQNTAGSGGDALPFTLGFHPGFSLPFTPGESAESYEFAFDTPQTPLMLVETPGGYVSGVTRIFDNNAIAVQLADDLFKEDSICLSRLTTGTVSLRNKNTGRYIRLGVKDFPYVLLWGPPQGPLPFVCMEPWHGLPDPVTPYGEFADKPGLTLLPPGESYSTSLPMEFA